MRARITKLAAGLAAIATLAFGGATLASASSKPAPVQPAVAAVDGDTVQQGDQTSADSGTSAEQSSESGASDTAGERPAESNSEIAGNDGPGGHADEPANASADYQFEGQQ